MEKASSTFMLNMDYCQNSFEPLGRLSRSTAFCHEDRNWKVEKTTKKLEEKA